MPEGKGLESVMVGGALIVSGMVAEPVAPLPESVTENVGVTLPETKGVPPRTPAGLMDMPAGRPDADQEAVPASPVTVSEVFGYGRFTVHDCRLVVPMSGAMVSEKSLVAESGVDELSVTLTVKVATVDTFTVPERVPSDERFKPAGSGTAPVTCQVYGVVPPFATKP